MPRALFLLLVAASGRRASVGEPHLRGRGAKWLRGPVVPASKALLGAAIAAGLVGAGPAAAGTTSYTSTYYFTGGEQTYAVPTGVRSVRIQVVGAPGAAGSAGAGGVGADVSASVLLPTNVITLYVEVGGPGGGGGVGGFNGGATGYGGSSGGGGGASDVRIQPISIPLTTADSRLVVAGGGGGGAGADGGSAGFPDTASATGAGDGGDSAALQANATPGGPGRYGSPAGQGGAGGTDGHLGTLGWGGNGGSTGGGGGGGGYYGGGGGAGGIWGGGGGGGSSYFDPASTNTSIANATTRPMVIITAQASFTSVSLSSSANPVTVGQLVTFTTTVTPNPGGGTVAFTDNTVPITGCTAAAVDPSSGQATCTTTALPAGSHAIQADFSGYWSNSYVAPTAAPPNFEPSSGTLIETVNAPAVTATSTTLVSSSNPATTGDQVTYTATITPVPGGGTMTFYDNGSPIAACQGLDASSGAVTCTATYASALDHAVMSAYSGTSSYAGSTSPTLIEVVISPDGGTSGSSDGADSSGCGYGGAGGLSGALALLTGALVARRRHPGSR